MNEAHRRLIKERYENAVHEYCHAYCQKHGYTYNPDGWVHGDVGGILQIGDKYISFYAMKADIDNEIESNGLGAQTDRMDFMSADEVCGNCKNGEVQSDGNYCRCIKRGKFFKFLDPACNIYERG